MRESFIDGAFENGDREGGLCNRTVALTLAAAFATGNYDVFGIGVPFHTL